MDSGLFGDIRQQPTLIQFAAPYSPARCRWHRDEIMKVARLARVPVGDFYFRVNNEIVVSAVRSARSWNQLAVRGGNDAYLWRVANRLPVEGWD